MFAFSKVRFFGHPAVEIVSVLVLPRGVMMPGGCLKELSCFGLYVVGWMVCVSSAG